MSASAFALVQAGLLAALAAAPALAGGRISTNRLHPIPQGQASAIVLRLDQAEGQEYALGSVDWSARYTVECYTRVPPGADPVVAVDGLLCGAWERLNALDPATLGANVAVSPRIDWQVDDADTGLVCAVIQITAQHRTALETLTPWN